MVASRVPNAGHPPASVVGYIEDMLNELASMAVAAGEPSLAPPIVAAAEAARQLSRNGARQDP